jgi:hypothetical protein
MLPAQLFCGIGLDSAKLALQLMVVPYSPSLVPVSGRHQPATISYHCLLSLSPITVSYHYLLTTLAQANDRLKTAPRKIIYH